MDWELEWHFGPTAGVTISSFGLENASMPWKESRSADERHKFIAEVLSGDLTMTDLCRRFGVLAEDRIQVEEAI